MGSYNSKHLAGTGSKEDPLAWDYSENNPEGKDTPIKRSDIRLRGPNKHNKYYHVIRYETSRGNFHEWVIERKKTWLLMYDKEYGATPFLYQGVSSTNKGKRHSPILKRDAWDWQKPCAKAGSGCHDWGTWAAGRQRSVCTTCGAKGPMGAAPDQLPWCATGKKGIGRMSIRSLNKQRHHIARHTRRR